MRFTSNSTLMCMNWTSGIDLKIEYRQESKRKQRRTLARTSQSQVGENNIISFIIFFFLLLFIQRKTWVCLKYGSIRGVCVCVVRMKCEVSFEQKWNPHPLHDNADFLWKYFNSKTIDEMKKKNVSNFNKCVSLFFFSIFYFWALFIFPYGKFLSGPVRRK